MEPIWLIGFCELGAVALDDVLTDINDFLNEHPNEVIVIFFGDYVSPDDTEDAFIRTGQAGKATVFGTQEVFGLTDESGESAQP